MAPPPSPPKQRNLQFISCSPVTHRPKRACALHQCAHKQRPCKARNRRHHGVMQGEAHTRVLCVQTPFVRRVKAAGHKSSRAARPRQSDSDRTARVSVWSSAVLAALLHTHSASCCDASRALPVPLNTQAINQVRGTHRPAVRTSPLTLLLRRSWPAPGSQSLQQS